MDEKERMAFLEEIGLKLVALAHSGRPTHTTHAIEHVDVVFINGCGEEWSLDLADAVHALAGDVYYFEEFDLRDAERVEVRYGGIPCC